MAYTNKVLGVAAVVLLVVAITNVDAQSSMFPNMDPICASVMPDLLEKCFTTVRVTPTEECCNGLKSATTTQVTCLCDNYIANPSVVNVTGPYSAGITTKCGVFDKFSCDGTSKGKEGSSNGKDNSKSADNGGRLNEVTASMAVFCLFASIFFNMF